MKDNHEFQTQIPLPSEEEKNRAVMRILDIAMPQKNSIWQELYQTAYAVGIRTLFFGVSDCFFLAVIILCVCLMPVVSVMVKMIHMAPYLFLVSPAFYALAQLLTMWKEHQMQTLEWKQTWCVSYRTVMALRMLVFGSVSVVVSILLCTFLWVLSRQMISMVWMLSVAFSALFLYGGSSLFCQRIWGMCSVVLVPVSWIVISLVPIIWEPAAIWLMQIPVVVFWIVTVAGGIFYFLQIYWFCSTIKEGGRTYAVR